MIEARDKTGGGGTGRHLCLKGDYASLLEPSIDKRVVIAGSHKTYGQNECHQEGTVKAPMHFSVLRYFVRYWRNSQYGDR